MAPRTSVKQSLRFSSFLCANWVSTERVQVRFVEDNWENPALGAWGLGWEVWMDGSAPYPACTNLAPCAWDGMEEPCLACWAQATLCFTHACINCACTFETCKRMDQKRKPQHQ